MAHPEDLISVLLVVSGATTEPFVSVAAFIGATKATILTASITRSPDPNGIEFTIRFSVPAASTGIVVRGEFEFVDVGFVNVSIGAESSPPSLHRKLSIAFAGHTASFETFYSLEADAEPTLESTKLIQGVRPTTTPHGSIADLIVDVGPLVRLGEDSSKLDPPQSVTFEVFFGTDRAVAEAEGAGATFTSRRGRVLTVGICKIQIPPSHRIGSIGSTLPRRLFGPDDRLKLIETTVCAVGAWIAAIRARLGSVGSTSPCGVVFVHGFNVNFREAAIRSAQLGYDLSIVGPMAFFSWPSRGTVTSYAADEATVDASEEYLLAFLEYFVAACAGIPVHIIAHSMGSRVVARTLARLRNTRADVRIDQLIFAAPDIDRDTFASLVLQFREVARQATLYVSARDTAVELSRAFHSAPRAGLYPPVTVLPGVDTVAVTNVDTSLLGHGYVVEAREILHDMHSVLHFGMTPQQRMGLRLMATGGSTHWLIGP